MKRLLYVLGMCRNVQYVALQPGPSFHVLYLKQRCCVREATCCPVMKSPKLPCLLPAVFKFHSNVFESDNIYNYYLSCSLSLGHRCNHVAAFVFSIFFLSLPSNRLVHSAKFRFEQLNELVTNIQIQPGQKAISH